MTKLNANTVQRDVGSRVGGPLLSYLFVGSLFRYTYRSQFLAVVEEFQGSTRASGSVVGHFSRI